MKNWFAQTGRLIGIIIAFCFLLVILIWSQLLRQLKNDRDAAIASAVQRNANLDVSLEQYAIRAIKNADLVLLMVKMEYEREGVRFDFNSLFKKGVIDLKYYNGVAIMNEKGDLQLTNMTGRFDSTLNFSDREYFKFQKNHANELFISKPIRSRTIDKAVIVLSRRLNKKDGSFAGTVAVQIEPSTFTQFYSKANLSPRDIISLIAPDGITYARRTGNKESYGEDIHKSPLFGYVAKNPVGNYFAKDAIRGIPTYFSYRRLEAYPIIATVGSAQQDVLAEYFVRAKKDYVFGIIITLLWVFFCALVIIILVHRRKNISRVKDNEARYRSVFENSYEGIILLSPDGYIEAMNEAAYQLFKVTVSDNCKLLFAHLFEQSSPTLELPSLSELHNNGTGKEIHFTCLDGSGFIGEIAYSNYKDFTGKTHLVINIRDITLRKQMQRQLLKEQKRFQRKLTRQIILAQERERESIGHELHDNVNQILTTVKLYLELALHNPETREQFLGKSIDHVMNCIREIRDLSHALSAPTLGTRSLIDSVKALIEMVSSSTGLKIHFIHETHTSVIKDQKLAIYRILQEQLTNIIKHAQATEITIRISQSKDTTLLQVMDNGKGFDVNARRNGIGLNNMISRAKVFDGTLKIDSQKNGGCVLQVTLPILAEQAEKKAS